MLIDLYTLANLSVTEVISNLHLRKHRLSNLLNAMSSLRDIARIRMLTVYPKSVFLTVMICVLAPIHNKNKNKHDLPLFLKIQDFFFLIRALLGIAAQYLSSICSLRFICNESNVLSIKDDAVKIYMNE